jgi:hypothetical protein
MEDDLEHKVTQLADELFIISLIDCLYDFVGFFEEHRLEALVRLLAVPRAPARGPEPRDQPDKLAESFACRAVR